MKQLMSAFVIAAMCAVGGAAYAQTTTAKADGKKAGQTSTATTKPAKTAKAATTVSATCKDGTTYTGKSKKGACSKHGGVKAWDKA